MSNTVQDVISKGFCVGCGACASIQPNIENMTLNHLGQYEPKLQHLTSEAMDLADKICPFSDDSLNETQLGNKIFKNSENFDLRIGHYDSVHVGYAGEKNKYREEGSSGGLTNWLLAYLLKNKLIDGAIVVGSNDDRKANQTIYSYQIIDNYNDLGSCAKSKYYPVELSQVVQLVKAQKRRFAFVGVPCYVKAIRNLCLSDSELDERIKFCISIVCGHQKSARYGEYLGAQMGINHEDINLVDFRVKNKGQPANRYATKLIATDRVEQRDVFDLDGTDWGLGFFKYKACDYCDDVAGETADITLGDAWLPHEIKDWKGNNIVIVRNREIAEILKKSSLSGEIQLRPSSAKEFQLSQIANYRHKVEGLSYRIINSRKAGEWVPQKRVSENENQLNLTKRRMKALDIRSILRDESHIKYSACRGSGGVLKFKIQMLPMVIKYHFFAGSLTKYIVKGLMKINRKFF